MRGTLIYITQKEEYKMQRRLLTFEQQYMLDQAIANMELSDMHPSEEAILAAQKIITGEITADEAVAEVIRKYSNNK